MSSASSRVLREVSGLARLNHVSIVRYYAAWLEHSGHPASPSSVDDCIDSPDDLAVEDQTTSDYIQFDYSAVDYMMERTPGTRAQGHVVLHPERVLYIQMEWCPGDTLRVLIDEGRIKNAYWQYFAQIVSAIQYIHGQGLIHRDLKPANIFVDDHDQLKLGDFGLAVESNLEVPDRPNKADADEYSTEVGTFFYTAPELLARVTTYDHKIDVNLLNTRY